MPEPTSSPVPAMNFREIVITPSSGWDCFNLPELLASRDLLYFLSWRNIAVRYKQTIFGVLWALVQPLATSGILTLVFGTLAAIPSDGQPYFLFSFCAMLPWTLFREAVSAASTSLVTNAHLVTKVYFPRILVPLSTIAVALVDFGVSLVALMAIAAWYGTSFTSRLLALPLLILLTALCSAAVGIGLAAINVRFRDVRFTIPFLLQCWMFATPIMYPLSIIPSPYRWLMGLNPMAGLVEGFRSCILGTPVTWPLIATSTCSTLFLCVLSLLVFRRMERYFADVI